MADTAIEWTRRPGTKGKTWNPLGGCSEDGPDCAGCYAKGMAYRIPNMARARGNTKLEQQYAGLTRKTAKGRIQWTGVLRTFDDRLEQPLSWKQPCTVFVNSMSDLFHAEVPFDFVRKVWDVMRRCPQHTFIVLTKRTDRLLEFAREHGCPPNVWLGFSAGNQEEFDRRGASFPELRQVLGPKAVLLASLEPLIGPIDLESHQLVFDRERSIRRLMLRENLLREDADDCVRHPVLSWVITGGESDQTYHAARACDVQWIRSIVEQCVAAGVPVFVKQLGSEPGFKLEDEERRGNFMPSFHHYDKSAGLHIKRLDDRKGGDPNQWPEEIRLRQFPEAA